MVETVSPSRITRLIETHFSDQYQNVKIKIGKDHQAFIPHCRRSEFFVPEPDRDYAVCLWNPKNFVDNQQFKDFLSIAKDYKYHEDQALTFLQYCKMDLDLAIKDVPNYRPIQTEWSHSEILQFFDLLDSTEKNFDVIYKYFSTKKSMKDLVLFYYLNKYKPRVLSSTFLNHKKHTQLVKYGLLELNNDKEIQNSIHANYHLEFQNYFLTKRYKMSTQCDEIDSSLIEYLIRKDDRNLKEGLFYLTSNILDLSIKNIRSLFEYFIESECITSLNESSKNPNDLITLGAVKSQRNYRKYKRNLRNWLNRRCVNFYRKSLIKDGPINSSITSSESSYLNYILLLDEIETNYDSRKSKLLRQPPFFYDLNELEIGFTDNLDKSVSQSHSSHPSSQEEIYRVQSESANLIKSMKSFPPDMANNNKFTDFKTWSVVDQRLLLEGILHYGMNHQKLSEKLVFKSPQCIALYIKMNWSSLNIPMLLASRNEGDENECSVSLSVPSDNRMDFDDNSTSISTTDDNFNDCSINYKIPFNPPVTLARL